MINWFGITDVADLLQGPNAKHYAKSPAVTEYYEFAGRDHWTCAAPGW